MEASQLNSSPQGDSSGSSYSLTKSEAYVRSLSFDPEGTYLAATEAHGYLSIHDLTQPHTSRALHRTKATPKVDILSSTQCNVAWIHDG